MATPDRDFGHLESSDGRMCGYVDRFGVERDMSGAAISPGSRVPGQMGNVAITGGSIFKPAPRFFGFGDSITVNGGRVINASTAPDVNVYNYSWHRYAEYATQGRFQWGGNFGLAGQTIAQLKNTYLPYVLAYAKPGDFVVMLMGQNDLGSVNAQTLSDYTSVVASLFAIGVTPVLCTLTPGATSRNFHALNSHIRRTAAIYALPLLDLTAAVTDPNTGSWLAAYTRDAGTHPSEAGAKVMGTALATLLNALAIPNAGVSAWLANCSTGYGPVRATQTGGNAEPLFLTDNAATPPLTTGWSIIAGSYATASSYSAATVGRSFKLTNSASNIVARNNLGTAVPGDRLRVSFIFTANVKAFSGSWGFGILDGAGNALYDAGRNNGQPATEDVARSVFSVDVTHSGTAGLFTDVNINGSGSNITLEQFTILNLTSMGVAA